MSARLNQVPPNVFLIIDHLESVLATAEELSVLTFAMPAEMRSDGAAAPGTSPSLKGFVDQIRTLELSIMSRALQARARARELRQPHPQLKMLLNLFIGGTAPLTDAVAELKDPRSGDFDTGNDPQAYLISRGMIPPDRGSLHGLMQLEVGDEFLVARRIALGPLMDLATQFLHTLDACYDLFRADATLNDRSGDDGRADREPRTSSSAVDTQTTRT